MSEKVLSEVCLDKNKFAEALQKGETILHETNFDVKATYTPDDQMLIVTNAMGIEVYKNKLHKDADTKKIVEEIFRIELGKQKEIFGKTMTSDLQRLLENKSDKEDDILEYCAGWSASTLSFWRVEYSANEGRVYIRPEAREEGDTPARYIFVADRVQEAVAFWIKMLDDKQINIKKVLSYNDLINIHSICCVTDTTKVSINVDGDVWVLSKTVENGKKVITAENPLKEVKTFNYYEDFYFTYPDYVYIFFKLSSK